MKTKKIIKTIANDKFTKNYNEIMKTSENTVIINTEWSEKGDQIQKFSLYENYSPVETSGNSTLISQ